MRDFKRLVMKQSNDDNDLVADKRDRASPCFRWIIIVSINGAIDNHSRRTKAPRY